MRSAEVRVLAGAPCAALACYALGGDYAARFLLWVWTSLVFARLCAALRTDAQYNVQ